MRRLTTLAIISFVVLQSCTNHNNSGDKKPIPDTASPEVPVLETMLADSLPPRPLPPPIPKDMLFKAADVARDFVSDKVAAEKKYQESIVVKGVIKSIIPTDHYSCTIILKGSASGVDVQCEGISMFKTKELATGMEIHILGKCKGMDGDVIMKNCIYVTDPVYE